VPASRSALPSVSVPASARFFQLSLELPPTRSSGEFDCELRDGAGSRLWKIPVSLAGTTGDISLLIPAAQLGAGTYEVVLRGANSRDTADVNPFRFRLSRQ
jgi:hypothetical protein